MTVEELIEKLRTFDPKTVVNIGSHSVYPGPFSIELFVVNEGFPGQGETQLAITPGNREPELENNKMRL